jgi:hypothetical protein
MQPQPKPELSLKSSVDPEEILSNAPKVSRAIRLDANVVAAFGDLFTELRRSIAALSKTAHTAR